MDKVKKETLIAGLISRVFVKWKELLNNVFPDATAKKCLCC